MPADPQAGSKAFGQAKTANRIEMWEPDPRDLKSEKRATWRNKPRKREVVRGEGGIFLSLNLLILICAFSIALVLTPSHQTPGIETGQG
jgi:hypothetical protein